MSKDNLAVLFIFAVFIAWGVGFHQGETRSAESARRVAALANLPPICLKRLEDAADLDNELHQGEPDNRY